MIMIDYTDRTPIYQQIINSIEKLIALGVLQPEEKLPSVRSLGIELSTNPNTVQKAYTALESKGIIYSVKGIGNFVSKNDLKENKLKDIHNKIKEDFEEAKTFGLTEEEYNKWITEFRGSLYDRDK